VIHTFIRPTAGGILFAAQAGMIGGMDPILGFGLGVLSAGSVHAVKAASRPLITATTGGLGNPLVSFIEDIVAAVATILALIVPILAALIMATILGVAAWVVWRWRERRRRRRQVQI
jgi:Flp pilus assembly protein TadB